MEISTRTLGPGCSPLCVVLGKHLCYCSSLQSQAWTVLGEDGPGVRVHSPGNRWGGGVFRSTIPCCRGVSRGVGQGSPPWVHALLPPSTGLWGTDHSQRCPLGAQPPGFTAEACPGGRRLCAPMEPQQQIAPACTCLEGTCGDLRLPPEA